MDMDTDSSLGVDRLWLRSRRAGSPPARSREKVRTPAYASPVPLMWSGRTDQLHSTHSERDEEEVREGVDGGRLTEPEQDRTETETEQSTHSRRGSYRRWTRIPCVVLYSVPTLPRVNHVRPRPRLRLRIHLHLRVCRSSYLLCSLIRPLTCTLGY